MEYTHLSQIDRNLIQHFFNDENLSISEIASKKAYCRHRNKCFFHNLKYVEFSKLFLQYYHKRYHGINATYHKIQVEHPNIAIPSIRQMFNLIKNLKWALLMWTFPFSFYVKAKIL